MIPIRRVNLLFFIADKVTVMICDEKGIYYPFLHRIARSNSVTNDIKSRNNRNSILF